MNPSNTPPNSKQVEICSYSRILPEGSPKEQESQSEADNHPIKPAEEVLKKKMTIEKKAEKDLPLENIPEDDIRENDILLGRGGKTNHHPGNARYLKIVEGKQVEYMHIPSRAEKTEYAMNMVRDFRQDGIRFLKKNEGAAAAGAGAKLWSDVGDTKMREKVR